MKTKINKVVTIFAFLLIGISAYAQKKKAGNTPKPLATGQSASIRVLAKSYGDSVVIRWAPTAQWAWSALNRDGYLIERIDLSQSGNPRRQVITSQPIKPLSLVQFKATFKPENKYAAIAAQCLYGNNFNLNIRKGAGETVDKANVWNSRFLYALQVADFDGNVAKAEGLRFTDKNVQKNGVYIYKVYAAALAPEGKIDTGNAMVQNAGNPLASKPKLTEVLSRDRKAELHWDRYQQEQYTAYYIERSTDGKNFSSLTNLPYFSPLPDSNMLKKDTMKMKAYELLKTQQVYIDSLPRNYQVYYYRVRGINAFAELSNYSDTLTAKGLDLTPPSAAIMENPKFVSGRKILIKWKKPLKEADFKGFYITRAKAISGPYTLLTDKMLAPSTTEYTDAEAFEHGENFYIVMAVDTAGNHSESMPGMAMVPDKTPPAAPVGLKGTIQKNGLVYLSWNANKEEDVKGYKVYFSNNNDRVYSQLTLQPTTDTSFVDSIEVKTLSKDVWYKVVAVDFNNNHSAYSAPLKLKRPRIIPPVAPLASRVYVDTGGVKIDWIQSPSEGVQKYIIYRKDKKSGWSAITTVKHDPNKKDFLFADKNVKPFVDYSYSAEAVDEDSLYSAKSTPVNATIKTIPEQPAITTLKVTYNEKTNQVTLNWQYNNTGNYFFVLYRATGNDALSQYRSVDSKNNQYTDFIPAGQTSTVKYAIQAVFRDNRKETRLSTPVVVNVSAK